MNDKNGLNTLLTLSHLNEAYVGACGDGEIG